MNNKQILIIGGLTAAILLSACLPPSTPIDCDDPLIRCVTATPEPTSEISATPELTPDIGSDTPEPETSTPRPTFIPTATQRPGEETPTPIVSWPGGEELLSNPGFEDGFRTITIGDCSKLDEDGKPLCRDHIVANGWGVGYAAIPYHPENSPSPDPDSDLVQVPPETKPIDIDVRVHAGEYAQYAFCAYETCTTAFYQIVQLTPGDTCQLSFNVQLWVAGGYDEEGRGRSYGIVAWNGEAWQPGSIPIFNPVQYTSDIATDSDKESATVRIFASMAGDQDALTESRLLSREFGFYDNIYDQYNELVYQFTPSVTEVMVGVQVQFKWRHAHNDFMVDSASLTCIGD